MKNPRCCQNSLSDSGGSYSAAGILAADKKLKQHNIAGRFFEILKFLIPGAILALLPKCPLCFAAYFAVFAGFGVTLTTAAYLRSILIYLCVGALLYLGIKHLRRIIYALRNRRLLIGY